MPLASQIVVDPLDYGHDVSSGTSDVPKTLNQNTARRLLADHGWVQTLGGKHVIKMEKPGERPITLPRHKGADYGAGLRAAILRQAGLKG